MDECMCRNNDMLIEFLKPKAKLSLEAMFERVFSAGTPRDCDDHVFSASLGLLQMHAFQVPLVDDDIADIARRTAVNCLAHKQPHLFQMTSAQVLDTKSPHHLCYLFPFQEEWHVQMIYQDSYGSAIKCRSASVGFDYYLPVGNIAHSPHDVDGVQCGVVLNEGCSIRINMVDIPDCMYKYRNTKDDGPPNESDAKALLKIINLQQTSENVEWLLDRVTDEHEVILIFRNFGLLHDSIAFAESSNVIIIDDHDEVRRWKWQILPALGVSPFFGGFVPFCFPPALSDADARLQRAYMALTDEDEPGAEVLEASRGLLLERLGAEAGHVSELDEDELTTAIGSARALIGDALQALRRVQQRRRLLEAVASEVLFSVSDAAVDEACKKERLREEWRRREHWVQRQSLERRGPRKGKNRIRDALPKPSKEEVTRKIRCVASLVEQRSRMYQQTSRSVATFKRLGMLEGAVDDDAELRRARLRLAESDGPDSLLDGEVLVLTFPGARKSGAAATTSAHLRAPAPSGFIKVLDDATMRDKGLRVAQVNESALKLAMEMSLAEAG